MPSEVEKTGAGISQAPFVSAWPTLHVMLLASIPGLLALIFLCHKICRQFSGPGFSSGRTAPMVITLARILHSQLGY
jgi:hypothetical protein